MKKFEWYGNLSLSSKLNIIIIFCIFLSVSLLMGIYVGISINTTINGAIDSESSQLELISSNITSILRHADAYSKIIVTDDFLQSISSKNRNQTKKTQIPHEYQARIILDRIIQQRDVVSSVVISFVDGRFFGSGHVDMTRLLDSQDEILRRTGNLNKNPLPSFVFHTRRVDYEIRENKVDSLAVIRKFISVDNARVVGFIIMNIREDTIKRLIQDDHSDSKTTTYVTDQFGNVVVSSSTDSMNSSLEELDSYRSLTKGGIVKVDHKRNILVSNVLPGTDWMIFRLTPLESLFLPGRRLIFIICFAGIMSLMVASIFSILLSRTITNRIHILTEAMVLAGQGDLEIRVQESNNDEIGKMTHIFNKMVGEISDLMSEVYQEQSDKRRFELMALQNQIKPHFLYNTLDGVCALIQLDRYEDALKMSKSLSLFYRGALSKGRNVILVEEELDIVKQYLTIQTYRYPDSFSYSINVESRFMNCRALKLSLQPLVENSLYHGLRQLSVPGKIRISAEDHVDTYHFIVWDNGKGILNWDSEGFGISSVKERIRLYFGEDGDLQISGSPGNTEVRIILPKTGRFHV